MELCCPGCGAPSPNAFYERQQMFGEVYHVQTWGRLGGTWRMHKRDPGWLHCQRLECPGFAKLPVVACSLTGRNWQEVKWLPADEWRMESAL